MKLFFNNILNYLRYIAFLVVFMSMLLQTVSSSIYLFSESDTELVKIDWEEDSDEEEKTEKEKTDEKIEPPVFNPYSIHILYTSATNYFQLQPSLLDFSLEIQVPPPKVS